jgi:hypothetical protein
LRLFGKKDAVWLNCYGRLFDPRLLDEVCKSPGSKVAERRKMIAFLFFVLAVMASPFKSKSRLEAEKCGAPTSADRLAARGEGSSSAYQQRPLVPRPDVSMVSIDPESRYDCST